MKYALLFFSMFAAAVAFGQTRQIVQVRNDSISPFPFSPGVISNGLLFVSGQVGTDPKTGKLVAGGIGAETTQTIQNIGTILTAGGASFKDVVSVTVYLSNMDDFAAMNAIYRRFFKAGNFPARTTVGVAKLVYGATVEMTMTAAVPKK